MPATKAVAAALVVLLAAGGAVASTGGAPFASDGAADGGPTLPADVHADATVANGTVTVTVTDGDAPLANVSVAVEAGATERTLTTDANGTVAAPLGDDADELEVELAGDGFEGELAYLVTDDGLRLVEESYEYAVDDGDDESEREDDADADPADADDDADDADDDDDDEDDHDDDDDHDDEDD
jgi:hypothetical protein